MKFYITERGDAALDQSWRLLGDVPIVLITKAPSKLGEIPPHAIVHCTITGFGGTLLEPGVKSFYEEIEAYRRIARKIGSERTVLRIDPIIPTVKGTNLAISVLAEAAKYIPNIRLRISFMDMYPHIVKRFTANEIPIPYSTLHAPLDMRISALNALKDYAPGLEICGEPDMNCTGCISQRDMDAIGLTCALTGKCTQRASCLCPSEKTEALKGRGQCAHNCLYCYWR